jgi:phage/conjugal plasmid C-4 type zinc finger TraR family protein
VSQTSDFDIELAEARVGQERDAGLARVRAQLMGQGADACIDCDDPIPEARRLALPSARRCAGCQTAFEEKLR